MFYLMYAQGVFLKTASSVALPLFQALPDKQLRIDGSKPAAVSPPSKTTITPKAASKPAVSEKKQREAPVVRQQGSLSKKAKKV
jgi:hypothetical protein